MLRDDVIIRVAIEAKCEINLHNSALACLEQNSLSGYYQVSSRSSTIIRQIDNDHRWTWPITLPLWHTAVTPLVCVISHSIYIWLVVWYCFLMWSSVYYCRGHQNNLLIDRSSQGSNLGLWILVSQLSSPSSKSLFKACSRSQGENWPTWWKPQPFYSQLSLAAAMCIAPCGWSHPPLELRQWSRWMVLSIDTVQLSGWSAYTYPL